MTRYVPDRFVLLLLATLLFAWLFPVVGRALIVAQDVIFIGVFLLFFLHGLRLPRADVAKAAKAWRLQGAILIFSFMMFPVIGWILARFVAPLLPTPLIIGIIYLAILPSTVQSAISYSAIGGGNVAASIVAAASSNLLGILLTPLLAALLLGGLGGVAIGVDVVLRIAAMLMLPFALGQGAQRWLGTWAQGQRQLLSLFDRGVILLAVYIAFAGAVASGALAALQFFELVTVSLLLLVLLALAFGGAIVFARLLRLERADRVTLIFAGAHKSIASGAPMAAVLFGGDAGLIILPAILYHMAQLVLSAPLSVRLAKGS